MYIQKFEITDHPFIVDTGTNFSLPDNSLKGSGLNYIVGHSGAGKSKFLQTFLPPPTNFSSNSWQPTHRIDVGRYKIKGYDESIQLPIADS